MNLYGEHTPKPKNAVKLNVTSAQGKDNPDRLAFSPMTLNSYKGYVCFENYWQSGKVIEGVDKNKHDNWWKKQTKPKRRYPKSKGMKILYAEFDGKKLDYIQSRKEVYIPEYYNIVKDKETLKSWIAKVKSGIDVVVYDFDGPRKSDRSVDVKVVTAALLKEKVNDTTFPFGHGYIIAGLLAGILLNK